jgi:hypothetical protein
MKSKILLLMILLSFSTLMFYGCKKDNSPVNPTDDKVKIISFYPLKGVTGTKVTITGSNFSMFNDTNLVYFNGILTKVDSVYPEIQPTVLICKVPDSATTGNISVKVRKLEAKSELNFTIVKLSSFSPMEGLAGTEITISGEGFGNDKSIINVGFGDKKAEILSINDNEIKAKVPDGIIVNKVPINIWGDGWVLQSRDSFNLIKSKWNFKTGTIEISGIICEFSNVSVFRYPPDYNETKNWIDSSAISWKNDLMSCPTNNNNKDTNYFCNDTKPIVYFKTAVILYPASNKSGILNINQSIHEFSKTPNDPYIDCIRTVSCESINYLINNDGSIEGYIMGQNLINCNLKFYYQYVSDYVSGNIKDYKQNTFVKILRFTDNSYIKITLYP